jgi:MFS family permease
VQDIPLLRDDRVAARQYAKVTSRQALLSDQSEGAARDEANARFGRKRIYHGWYIVLATFVAQMLAIGLTAYSVGLFIEPVSAEFGLSRANANVSVMVIILGMACASPFTGLILDRFSARIVMVTASVLFGLGLIAISFVKSPMVIAALLFAPVSLCAVGLTHLTTSTLVSRWFRARRGRALGIAAISASASGVVVVKLIATLIEQWGWREAVLIYGVVEIVVVSTLCLIFIRNSPGEMGLNMDGADSPPEMIDGQNAHDDEVYSVRRLLSNRDYWCISISTGLTLAIDYAIMASLVPYGRDRGLSISQAAMLISMISIVAAIGKFVSGYYCDRIDKRWILWIANGLTITFMAILLINPSYPILLVACATAGMSIGGTVPVWYATVAHRFGTRSYGAALGLMIAIHTPLLLASVRFAGEVFDRYHGYDLAFASFIGVAIAAAIVISPVELKPRGRPAM